MCSRAIASYATSGGYGGRQAPDNPFFLLSWRGYAAPREKKEVFWRGNAPPNLPNIHVIV